MRLLLDTNLLTQLCHPAREENRALARWLEEKKRAQEALSYNGLVQSWPEITRLARETAEAPRAAQLDLL